MNWQPIETAPKDGTHVWVRAANGWEGAGCYINNKDWCGPVANWAYKGKSNTGFLFNDLHRPTEWRELTDNDVERSKDNYYRSRYGALNER